jgi:hypothetical protein
MLLHFYVEEPSVEAALIYLVPLILQDYTFEYDIFPFQGKASLLRHLPDRLKAYRYHPGDWRVIVLLDRDSQDCRVVKQELEAISCDAGLNTLTTSREHYQVINRIAIEELEAWFFGDVEALVAAYPRINPNLGKKAPYRDPDAIKGGTWEKLESELLYYHPGGLEKIRAAEEIAQYMNPARNRSKSFQVFRDALVDIFSAPR